MYLKKARRLNPKSPAARFYCEAASFLSGKTVEGMRQMDRAVNTLPENKRWKMVATLNRIISEESSRKELMSHFDKHSLQFKVNKDKVRKRKTATQIVIH
jgi:hypothetical protein